MTVLIYHHVMPGDTLIGIARQHYGDSHLSKELAQHNHLVNVNHLVAGRACMPHRSTPIKRGLCFNMRHAPW